MHPIACLNPTRLNSHPPNKDVDNYKSAKLKSDLPYRAGTIDSAVGVLLSPALTVPCLSASHGHAQEPLSFLGVVLLKDYVY